MLGASAAWSRHRLHSRLRAAALAVTIFLVLFEVMLGRRVPDQPYSGILINNLSVERVAPDSPGAAAGFQKGDRVLAVEGIPCSNFRDISQCMSRVRPGDTMTYQVRRGERTLFLPVMFSRPPPSEVLRKGLIIFVGLSFVTIGLLVYYRRSDKMALVFYLLCLTFGLVLANVVNFEVSLAKHPVKAAFYDLLVLALPALFLHFFLTFPGRSPLLRRHPAVEYVIYLPGVLLFALSQYINIMIFAYGSRYTAVITAFQNISAVYFAVFVVLGLVAFVRSYLTTRTASMRAKLRLVVWGTILGTLPLVFVRVVLSIRPEVEIPGDRLVFLPLLLVPAAFGHAIVRHRLMDLEIVVKRSLVYTILTAVLAAIYFAVVYGVGRIASRYIGRADLPFSVIAIFCISLLISPLRSRIRSSVEKLFFRDEYNYRKVLRQISHSLAGIVELDNLLGFLATRTGEVLHSRTVAIYLHDQQNGDYTAHYAVNADPMRLGTFPTDGGLIACLKAGGQTLNVERGHALDIPLPLSEAESAVLASIDSALVVPLTHKSSLLGFMSIGRRLGSGYYASADVELLETLCDQASVAIENARLYLETVEKHKMEQELEVAREIQSRLLPKGFPEIRGLKTHGVNVPSKHVGGDYYDVLPLGAGKVAVIIADVSGKGVPAALLMASLQSSLMAEADAGRTPSEVITNLNVTIYEHTSGDTFVTIFYGVIDFERQVLNYCSAGQTPPFIVHKDLSSDRLDRTDLVLGIESRPGYHDNQVPIGAGDLIFLYTDGITDELNDQEDPFGEERLIAELRRGYHLDLEELVERVYRAVLRHTNGKPQDDLTALAVRIETLSGHHSAPPTRHPLEKTSNHLA
jgi:sigma-B regulation protein RsbU (phosphoserine phosphatase)